MRNTSRVIASCVAAGLLLAACATTTPTERPLVEIDEPGLGVVAMAQPGEAIIELSRYRLSDGLVSSGDIVWTVGLLGIEYKIPPGNLVAARRNGQYTYYVGTAQHDFTAIDFTMKTLFVRQEIRIRNSGPAIFDSDSLEGAPFPRVISAPKLERAILRNYGETGYEKGLLYRGRTNDLLKFEYHEVSGNRSQPNVTQGFEHDLKDGRIVSYGGARVEVLELDGEQITYRVLATFPEKSALQ